MHAFGRGIGFKPRFTQLCVTEAEVVHRQMQGRDQGRVGMGEGRVGARCARWPVQTLEARRDAARGDVGGGNVELALQHLAGEAKGEIAARLAREAQARFREGTIQHVEFAGMQVGTLQATLAGVTGQRERGPAGGIEHRHLSHGNEASLGQVLFRHIPE